MSRRLLPVRRVRLEVDRALRTRPFFARAIRGDLLPAEGLDLVAQLGLLVTAVPTYPSRVIDALSRRGALGGGTGAGEPCPAAGHFAPAARSYARCLGEDAVVEVGLAVLGTSWTRAAAGRLGRSAPRVGAFLRELSLQGPRSLARLEWLVEQGLDAGHVHALAELTRGAVLGLATHLDRTWPAPVSTRAFSSPAAADATRSGGFRERAIEE